MKCGVLVAAVHLVGCTVCDVPVRTQSSRRFPEYEVGSYALEHTYSSADSSASDELAEGREGSPLAGVHEAVTNEPLPESPRR
jgi:hypothetical protein